MRTTTSLWLLLVLLLAVGACAGRPHVQYGPRPMTPIATPPAAPDQMVQSVPDVVAVTITPEAPATLPVTKAKTAAASVPRRAAKLSIDGPKKPTEISVMLANVDFDIIGTLRRYRLEAQRRLDAEVHRLLADHDAWMRQVINRSSYVDVSDSLDDNAAFIAALQIDPRHFRALDRTQSRALATLLRDIDRQNGPYAHEQRVDRLAKAKPTRADQIAAQEMALQRAVDHAAPQKYTAVQSPPQIVPAAPSPVAVSPSNSASSTRLDPSRLLNPSGLAPAKGLFKDYLIVGLIGCLIGIGIGVLLARRRSRFTSFDIDIVPDDVAPARPPIAIDQIAAPDLSLNAPQEVPPPVPEQLAAGSGNAIKSSSDQSGVIVAGELNVRNVSAPKQDSDPSILYEN